MKNIGTHWTADQILQLKWNDLAPYFDELIGTPLEEKNLTAWLDAWSNLINIVLELENRLYVAAGQDTSNQSISEKFETFYEQLQPRYMTATQTLKEKLIESKLEPAGFEIALRNMRAEAALFTEDNLPLISEQALLASEYDKIVGAQTIEWNGSERTVTELQSKLLSNDRALREQVWKHCAKRQLADREALNSLWTRLLRLRAQMAKNAGCADFRDYSWKRLLRFAYTPEDAERFHAAIEAVVVPAISRRQALRGRSLKLETLRPWDVLVDPLGLDALKPYQAEHELDQTVENIFYQIDPVLGGYFTHLREAGLMDLHNRKNKAPGGFCVEYPTTREAGILLNCVGKHEDVQAVIHEGGHAFHAFEVFNNPACRYGHQFVAPMEFAEVASMAAELLALPYLGAATGGFYSPADHRRAEIEVLETALAFLPYMSVVDLFQHWVYTHAEDAVDPANCDRKWAELWQRFMPDADWNGFEAEKITGWQRKVHIFADPFYYIEYGLAQLGALEIWENAQKDPARAVRQYRESLAQGGMLDLRSLYRRAGIELVLEQEPLERLVGRVLERIAQLENNSVSE
ncbi:MAG: M3 family oligoendopeptidase [Anaerolineaceae bacterium]|nr:M3 family oligoendopeptidase [Anaerolineaceae bacterium]